MKIIYRTAEKKDLSSVFALVQELALFEKAPEQVITSVEILEKDFENQIFKLIVAEDDKKIIGMALYYVAYSTWKGQMFFLDDLIVTEAYRGKGVGRKLLDLVIEDAKKSGVKQMRWQVLDWNEPAIKLYESYAGVFLDREWITCKLSF